MRTTKNSFILALLSVLLCFSMLIGSTYAWFTDRVTSDVNTIVAGNLDIQLEYWNGTDWTPVTSSTLLFDNAALWEPGHTEVAYLRISNVGTLSLKYKLAVNVGNEVSGTNVDGDPFNLSDYLVFGKVDMASATAFYPVDSTGRAQARADAGSSKLATYTEADKLYTVNDANKPADAKTEKYIALIIYMPEDVGNEANYMSGTTPPQVELGISLVATQLNSESDSYGSDYDSIANGAPDNINSWNDITLTASVPKPVSGPATVAVSNLAITVPEGAIDSGATALSLAVQEKDPTSVTVPEGSVALVYDISLEGKKAEGDIDDGDELVVTITDLPKGLNNVYIYWDNAGTPVDMNATYDPVAGTATFTTKHFSTYALVYDGPIKVYSEEDFGLVTSSFRRLLKDRTYVLMNDITDSKLMAFNDGVTIDLNGFTLTTSASYWTNFSNVDYTEINFIDSSTAKTGKIINSSGNLFNLSRNETVITFDESIELVSTAFAAVLFRTQTNSPNTTTVTINNAKATGQFYQAQQHLYSITARPPENLHLVLLLSTDMHPPLSQQHLTTVCSPAPAVFTVPMF
jgi:predicted ribosomally synthesized peptide with SipW-like signal peptide